MQGYGLTIEQVVFFYNLLKKHGYGVTVRHGITGTVWGLGEKEVLNAKKLLKEKGIRLNISKDNDWNFYLNVYKPGTNFLLSSVFFQRFENGSLKITMPSAPKTLYGEGHYENYKSKVRAQEACDALQKLIEDSGYPRVSTKTQGE